MTIDIGLEMQVINCGQCGGAYAIGKTYYDKKWREGGYWHCPYCECSWGFSNEASQIAKLKRQLEYEEAGRAREREYAKREREARERTERQLSATRGVVTRIKNRVGKGICPCCNRTFANLQRHMESQHPTFAETAAE